MEGKKDISNIEQIYQTQIAELKARFIAEKEELTSLFLDKLKEVEDYHKKMLQDIVIRSSTDLDAIQAKNEEKLNILTSLHCKELESLQTKVQALQSDKEELRKMLMDVCNGRPLPKEKMLSFLKNDSAKALNVPVAKIREKPFDMLDDLIEWVFPPQTKSVCVASSTETSDDWSSILFFIVLIKCRNAIGKMLTDEDES